MKCKLLAEVGYHEARGEPDRGIAAVMHVVKNRANHPKYWPYTLRAVVYQKQQFSYTHDGSLKKGFTEKRAHDKVMAIAWDVYSGMTEDPTNGGTYYHNNKVNPVWRTRLDKTVVIGNHIFYKRKES